MGGKHSKHFTDRVVRSLKTDLAQQDVWDSSFRLRGISFGVRVYRAGTKEYICRYRNQKGRRPQVTLGDARVKSLADARAAANDIKTLLAEGKDPAQKRSDYKAASTFAELCDSYLRLHASKYKKDGGKQDRRVIEQDLVPAWGRGKASDVRRADVISMLERIAIERNAPVMANRTRALISKIFNFALEREIVQSSPCSGLPKKYREKQKDRVLSDEEIKQLWGILEEGEETLGNYFKVVLLTGQRPGEVAAMRWDEIEGLVWTLPAIRTKNGQQHRVPISNQVKTILEKQRIRNSSMVNEEPLNVETFCFPAVRGEYLPPRTIQKAARTISKALGGKSFTAHDLRRTAATNLRKLGISRETVANILNHKSAVSTVTGIYDRYDEWPEMKEALERWGRKLESISAGKIREKVKAIQGINAYG